MPQAAEKASADRSGDAKQRAVPSSRAGVASSFKSMITAFQKSYNFIVNQSLERYYAEELPGLDSFLQRDKEMFEYTILGGQCFRGVLVCAATLEMLKKRRLEEVSEERMVQIMSVGWALEILQAAFLVADDIMDESHTRRGKACWHKVDRVHAFNDVFKLEHFAFYVLKRHLNKEEFASVEKVFRSVILKTTFGQGLDLEYSSIIKRLPVRWDSGEVKEKLSMSSYEKIVAHKTSYYTFHLPLAAALCLAGEEESEAEGVCEAKDGRDPHDERELSISESISRIALELGQYFQVQDDFLDVYGDPKKTGKIGTDIEQRKLTWLMARAVQKADEKTLQAAFKSKEKYVETMKQMFMDLELRKEYLAYENAVCAKIQSWVEKGKGKIPSQTILLILKKIHSSRIQKEATN
eukprot:CAMPEP_0114510388 /NCGR_PEP_ID=MMETSP0109-20121206/13758_1 /TAXON_ID=29199 /ORGANISM="Chlorarachnion reptans, Strain CCCM449" /LENGTH=408 /DNA_ID=CAMNT_0001689687 /DNA_START=30 /DNA_END=1256 /DNA_ORIENTATION=+